MADLKTIAGLRLQEGSKDTFTLVVRWVLGDGGSDALPAYDAEFTVEAIEAKIESTGAPRRAGRPLDVKDFKITPIRQILKQAVSPRQYFMLDTPRDSVDWPFAVAGHWLQTKRPDGPVKDVPLDQTDLSKVPFGVVNLLHESDRDRVANRVAQRVLQAFPTAMRARPNLAYTQDTRALADLAGRFADWLVTSGARPAHVPHIIRRSAARLSGTEAALSRALVDMPHIDLWAPDASVVPHIRLQELALISAALGTGSTFDDVRDLADQAEQVRGHIRLRTLHGGKLLDYWSDPDSGGTGSEADRGRQFYGSEILGLGRSFSLDRTDIEGITAVGNGIVVTVTQTKVGTTKQPPFDPGTSLLRREIELKYALKGGSSHPPVAPTGASINYDLVEVPQAADAAVQMNGRALGFRTGDGRIEIAIDPLPAGSPAAAWNVYGMWEGHKASQPFFDNPAKMPTLADLAPWLMTRRYSFARDLGPALVDPKGDPLVAALEAALRQPAWQPVLPVPTTNDDRTDERSGLDDKPLPSKGDKGSARFAFDLRKGFLAAPMKPPADLPDWDIAVPPDPTWSARKWRPDSSASAMPAVPQRYRFFVTAVDPLDQESDPIAVAAADLEAGEVAGTIFSLRQRSRLMPPPGNDSASPLSLRLVSAQAAFPLQLKMQFSTPYASYAAHQQDSKGKIPLADPATLTAWATILRKRPKPPILPLERDKAILAMPAAEPWQSEIDELVADGWEQVSVQEVAAPNAQGIWELYYETDDVGAGYLYMGVAGFKLKGGYVQFWAPNVAARTAQLLSKGEDGKMTFSPEPSPEVIGSSPLAKTPELLVSDARPPNMPTEPAALLVPALPILPPPGLDRDLVLQRLATCDFADKGVKIDPVAWSDDATTLTLGQIAMCESALERLTWSGDPASAADLRPSRTILALGTRTDTGKPQQSPTIGFRGLAQLSWRYAPMATIPAAQRPALSETAAFKIYQARCPLEASLAKAAANGEVTLTAVDGKGAVRLSGTSDAANAALASIELGVPAVVLIPQANGLCIAYVIRSAKGARAATAAQLKSIDGQPLPTKGAVTTATLHLGHGLWIVEQNPKTPQLNGKLFVPLGGGPQETFVWWIAPLSYAGLEARTQDCPACCQTLTGSIQPPPPLQYQATQPTRADEHRLEDVAKYRAFLPAGVVDDSDAASLPRLVINWTAGDQSSDVFLMIERDEQEIKKQDARIMAMLDMKAWEALKAIEGLKDGAAIEKAWLGAIRTGWLRGMPVEAEPSAPTTFRRIGLRAKIPATAGIVQLTDPTQPAGSAKRPTFIDYFGRNGDDMVVMNGNYEFRYRLRAFRDLGTGSDGPHYLYSRPTAWTNFAIPERPPIQVVAQMGAAQPADYSLFAPRVTFRLQTPEKITERTSPWFFRALLRRYVEVPMPSASPGKPSARAQWIDVGQTAVIEWNGIAAEITDDELQREWAAQKLNPNYRIQVQAFRRDDTDSKEVLVRSFDIRFAQDGHDEINVAIAGLKDELAAEQPYVVEVKVI